MFKYTLILVFFTGMLIACKQKKKEPEKKYTSSLSLIQSQVAHVDTSLYPIVRMDYRDSLLVDSIDIPREVFRETAKDFLDIPDLADPVIAKRFRETVIFDETINRVMITYTPEEPANEEIQKQEVLVTPDPAGDKVTSIIITKSVSNRDSAVRKNMLWQMDRYFQVTTIRQLPGQPETTTTLRVTWNEEKYQ